MKSTRVPVPSLAARVLRARRAVLPCGSSGSFLLLSVETGSPRGEDLLESLGELLHEACDVALEEGNARVRACETGDDGAPSEVAEPEQDSREHEERDRLHDAHEDVRDGLHLAHPFLDPILLDALWT